MSRKVKCPLCNALNDKENTQELDGRYYCIECAKIREAEKTKHTDGWNELYDYICELYNIPKLTGMMFKQIKDFRDNYGYKNKGMYLTLKYYYEVLENEIKEDTGLGIIVYYYEKAQKHWFEVREIQKHLENFEVNEELNIVKVKNINIKDLKSIKQLSLDNVNWEEVNT
jgi:hypothetical protein